VSKSGGGYSCSKCGKDCDPPDDEVVVLSEDFDDFFSAFKTDESKPKPKPVVVDDLQGERAFWDDLIVANGENTMGHISLLDGLTGELKDPGQNNRGLMHIRAVSHDDGWNLYGTHTPKTGSQPCYFLPWKAWTTTYADRSWYENSVCKYFVTTRLSGCRFAINDKQVLHVASNANGALDDFPGSKTRDIAEREVTRGNPLTRRASVSGMGGYGKNDKGGIALVFGMRLDSGGWCYKLYVKHTDLWTTIWI
jgi:hypothetical protein